MQKIEYKKHFEWSAMPRSYKFIAWWAFATATVMVIFPNRNIWHCSTDEIMWGQIRFGYFGFALFYGLGAIAAWRCAKETRRQVMLHNADVEIWEAKEAQKKFKDPDTLEELLDVDGLLAQQPENASRLERKHWDYDQKKMYYYTDNIGWGWDETEWEFAIAMCQRLAQVRERIRYSMKIGEPLGVIYTFDDFDEDGVFKDRSGLLGDTGLDKIYKYDSPHKPKK